MERFNWAFWVFSHEGTSGGSRPRAKGRSRGRGRGRGRGGGFVLLALPAFLPSVISYFLPKLKGSLAPPLDLPLGRATKQRNGGHVGPCAKLLGKIFRPCLEMAYLGTIMYTFWYKPKRRPSWYWPYLQACIFDLQLETKLREIMEQKVTEHQGQDTMQFANELSIV